MVIGSEAVDAGMPDRGVDMSVEPVLDVGMSEVDEPEVVGGICSLGMGIVWGVV